MMFLYEARAHTPRTEASSAQSEPMLASLGSSVSPKTPCGPDPQTMLKFTCAPETNPHGTDGFLRSFGGPPKKTSCVWTCLKTSSQDPSGPRHQKIGGDGAGRFISITGGSILHFEGGDCVSSRRRGGRNLGSPYKLPALPASGFCPLNPASPPCFKAEPVSRVLPLLPLQAVATLPPTPAAGASSDLRFSKGPLPDPMPKPLLSDVWGPPSPSKSGVGLKKTRLHAGSLS